MPSNIGYSFSPSQAQPVSGQRDQAAPLSPQEAVQLFNLRVPERPNNVVPLPLLTSRGVGGLDAGSLGGLLTALIAAFGKKPKPQFQPVDVPAIDNGVGSSPRGPEWQPMVPDSGQQLRPWRGLDTTPNFVLDRPQNPEQITAPPYQPSAPAQEPEPLPVTPLPIPSVPAAEASYGNAFGSGPDVQFPEWMRY